MLNLNVYCIKASKLCMNQKKFWRNKMKKGIHPDYHEITYMKTKSTWGKACDAMRLEIDTKSHPVWTGIYRMVDTGGQLSKFKNKFGAFGLKTGDDAAN